MTFEEEAFGEEGHNEEEEEELTDDGPLSPGVHWLRTEADSVHLIGAPVCFAYISAILTLARINVVSCVVKGCTDPTNIIIKDNFIGSAMYLKWVRQYFNMVKYHKIVYNEQTNSSFIKSFK